ncbi:MAG: FecR domain-containing protein [Bacteroidales bacterium]
MINKNKIANQIMEDFTRLTKNVSNEEAVFTAGKLIHDVENIDVEAAYKQVMSKIDKRQKVVKHFHHVLRYAAIVILPIIVTISFWLLSDNGLLKNKNQLASEYSIQEIVCPIGMRSSVILPDGTKVLLNSGSSIKYKLPFVKKERNIELVGEAFLDVEKNDKVPFIVQSQEMKIIVTGTQFNVMSYPEDNKMEVALKEGSVSLDIMSKSKTNQKELKMIPGDHFSYNKISKKSSLKNENLETCFAWVNNKMIFNDTPMLEMINVLERWYGVEIELADPSLKAYKFSTTFNNLTLEEVLKLLEMSSPMTIKYILGKVDPKTNTRLKTKIIISKKN